MTNITAALVQELRASTGAGIMDAKKALIENNGDTVKAAEWLRKAGKLKAAKKQDRIASEGLVECYIHTNGKIGSMVQLKCETDFVARNQEFKQLAHDIALQIVALSPRYVAPENVPGELVEKEKEIYREQMKGEKKPPEILEKIITGKVEKWFSEICLMKQKYFKDDSMTVEELVTSKIAKLGENIQVGDFVLMTIDGKISCS